MHSIFCSPPRPNFHFSKDPTYVLPWLIEFGGRQLGANNLEFYLGRLCFSTFLRALSFRPDILVIDECGCSKSRDLAIPMMALGKKLTRMVLAGDPRQLPPPIFTKLAQKIWGESILAQLTGRGHTTKRLNIEYRCHSDLDYLSTTSTMVPTG